MAERRRVDLDALLQENGLDIVFGGATYTLTDVPLEVAALASAGEVSDDQDYLWRVLSPCCGEDEAWREKLRADLKAVGPRTRQALVLTILDFSAGSDLLEKLNVSPRLRAALQTGSEQ